MLEILQFLTGIDFQRLEDAERVQLVFTLGWKPVWIVLVLAAVGFLGTLYVGWLYRRESIVLSKGKRILLTALRVFCILVVVFILLGPKLVMRKELPKEEIVVVLYDTSQSMSLPYGTDNPQVTVPLARLLGEMSAERKLSDQLTPEEQAVLMEMSKKERIEVVRHILQDPQLNILKRMSRTFDVAVYSFNSDLDFRQSVPKTDPDDPDARTPVPPPNVQLDKSGQTTALGNVIRRIFDRENKLEGLDGKNVVAVVVFTDGQVNEGETLDTTGKFLARNGVPVFNVGIGHHEPPRDVLVSNMTMDPTLLLNQESTIGVKVTAHGFGEDEAVNTNLVLKRREASQPDSDENWKPVPTRLVGSGQTEPSETSQTVVIPAGSSSRDVSLVIKPATEGNYVYRVEVTQSGIEIIPGNNMISRLAEVTKAKLKVLLVDAYPRWEYRYLRDMLVRDKERIDSACYLVFDPYIISPEGSMVADDEFKKVPATRKLLSQFHVIIIGDVPIESLEAQAPSDGEPFSVALNKVVREDGRGVIFIAGEYNNPYGYTRPFKHRQDEYSLAQMLPIRVERSAAGYYRREGITITKGFKLDVTTEGYAHPMMRFSGREKENREIWESMQSLFWFATNNGRKLGATVLAEHPTERVPGKDEKIPLIATQRVGNGRVLYLGIDETWRWRWRVGDLYTSAFWNNAIRQVASQKRTLNVQMELARDAYNLGEKVDIEVLVRDRQGNPYTGSQPVEARIIPQAQGVEAFNVRLSPVREKGTDKPTGRFRGSFIPSAPGSYRIEVRHPTGLVGAEGQVEVARANLLVQVPKLEFENPAMARQALMDMAQMTGKGKFVTLGEIDSLPALVSSIRKPDYVPHEFDIDRAPLWFILFLVCISTEWAVRKFNRLL